MTKDKFEQQSYIDRGAGMRLTSYNRMEDPRIQDHNERPGNAMGGGAFRSGG